MKTLCLLFIISMIASCGKDKIITENTDEAKLNIALIGKWKAVSLFLSDASTGVCHQNTSNKDIIFEFKNELTEDKIGYNFYGNGPVNNYFGSFSMVSLDETNKIGKIKVGLLGSTKMAGSPEMMECELNLFTMLRESTGFQLFEDDPNRLIIGRLKDKDSHPRDGGTYFVFERVK